MLTQDENDLLTRVGPGTPAGNLLRRYWHVAAAACELSEEHPIKPVRMFGEDLVLFRMPPKPGEREPSYGLVGERCPHRLTSFKFGLVDCEGIRCIYHGWKFAPNGACLEMPAEDPGSTFKDRMQHRAYPVKKLAGLLFAYLGPLPAPELPRWDVLAREDGWRWGVIESVIDCNWLQAMENSVDPSHLFWLHGSLGNAGAPARRRAQRRLRAAREVRRETRVRHHAVRDHEATDHAEPETRAPAGDRAAPLGLPDRSAPRAVDGVGVQAGLGSRQADHARGSQTRLRAQHALPHAARRRAHDALQRLLPPVTDAHDVGRRGPAVRNLRLPRPGR